MTSMRRYLFSFLLTIIISQFGNAQSGAIKCLHLSGGIATPYAPSQFYDYWAQGFQLMVGVEFSGSSRFIQFIAIEYNAFSFDQERFAARLNMDKNTCQVTGATSRIIGVSYIVRYPFTEYENLQPTLFAGVGCASSYLTSFKVDYINYPISQDGKNNLMVTFPLGASVNIFKRESYAVDVNFTYTIGFTKNQDANTNYMCFKIDCSYFP